jgi:SRSO17 transposase
MIARAIAASVPFKWVAADTSTVLAISNSNYVGRQRLCARGQQRSCISILGQAAIGRRHRRGHRPDAAASDWKRLSAGAGTKGPRLHDWCYLELADLEGQFNSANDGLWTRGLLIRRHIADGDLAFFTTWCPAGTSIETLVRSKAIGGRSRTVLRPRKTSSGSITTRADPGMAGIATFLW